MRGSKVVVAKVGRITARSIEHVQSISRSQRSTGTLGFYFVTFLAVVKYKRRHAKYTYNYKSYKYRHYEKSSRGIFMVGVG